MKRYPGVKPSKAFAFQLKDDLTAKGSSKASIMVYLYAVKLWYEAVNDGLKLDIKMPKAETHDEADFLTYKEVRKLLETKLNYRDRAVVALMLGCGIRRKELSGLNVADFDLDIRVLHVRANDDADIQFHGTKTKKSGTVSVPKSMMETLETYMKWRLTDETAKNAKTNALILSMKNQRLTVR